jgi:hypothetical protein
VLGLALALLLVSFLPQVENPWPDTIGIGFPFAAAGACGVLASVLFTNAERDRRDQAIRRSGLFGFCAGVGFYVLSLVVQVAF